MQPMSEPSSAVEEVIDRLDEYIENPKLVTTQTLTELRDMLLSDGEPEMEDTEEEDEAPGLVIAIGKKASRAGRSKMKNMKQSMEGEME